jgi:hypothetical protein
MKNRLPDDDKLGNIELNTRVIMMDYMKDK